jgi:hypothetical protein
MDVKLDSIIAEENFLLIREDKSSDLVEIMLNGRRLYLGRFESCSSESQKGILPEQYKWEGSEGLVTSLVKYIKDSGKKVLKETRPYDYED